MNENQEKKARLAKAGESLKKSLVFNSKLRATSKALEKLNENPAKKGNLKETMMPSFKIHSCDHLGLLTTSFNRLLN